MPRKGAEPDGSPMTPVGYRDTKAVLAEVDQVAKLIAPEGAKPSRSDAVRVLVGEALAARRAKAERAIARQAARRGDGGNGPTRKRATARASS